MNNRLGDLPAWAMEDSDDSDDDVPKPSKNGGDIEMQNQEKDEHKQYMEDFFREVDSIKADIDAVAQASKDIAKINEQSMRATTTSEEQKLSKQLKPLIDNTNKRAKRTKNLLGLLKEETDQLKAQGKLNASDIRVRENMNTTLTKKFVDEMKIYQQAQQQYKTDIKKKVKWQLQVVKPDATDEEVDAVMKSEGGRDALYKQSILAGGVNDQIKTTYAKVAGKYQDVLTLEQSVAELHQMFLDFALLTEQQGELLDQIEFQVKQAGDYVEEANVDVHQAIEYQKSIRKKQCWIIVIVIIALVVILFATGIISF
jgi:t-SNARE complex subunit (syntaxin)